MSPQSSPAISVMPTTHVQNTLHYFQCEQPGDVFRLLLDLGDEMRDTVDDFPAAGDLPQLNQLFSAVVHHSAYGLDQSVDETINKLLLIAILRCEEMCICQLQPDQWRVGWQSFAQSQADEHLEFYRNFLNFITSHPAWCLSQDKNLELAQKTLHRLCPRVNGLSRWTWQDDDLAERRDARRSNPARVSTPCLRPQPAKKPPSRLPRRARVPLPTPPTQTGDANFSDTIPTMPLKRPWKQPAALPTPASGAPSRIMRRAAAVLSTSIEDATSLLCPKPVSVKVPWMNHDPRPRALHRPAAHKPPEFRLRPEHTPSPRCCMAVASEVWN